MYSDEHISYIKKIKRKGRLIRLGQLLIIILLVIFWQLLADFKLINTFITSSPKQVVETIIDLHKQNNLYHHIWVTTYETLISFSLGTLIGCIIATLLWWNKTISKILDPYLTILNSLPKVALGPIIIIWGGAGIKSIIVSTTCFGLDVINVLINLKSANNCQKITNKIIINS